MMEITAHGYKHTDNIVRQTINDERNYENNQMHIRPPRIPTLKIKNMIAVAHVAAMSAAAHAQTNLKTSTGDLNYEVGYPTKETSEKLYDEIDFQRACQAYMWSFPAVSFASIKAGFVRDLGANDN